INLNRVYQTSVLVVYCHLTTFSGLNRSETTTEDCSIRKGHRSQLLHFQSSSLLWLGNKESRDLSLKWAEKKKKKIKKKKRYSKLSPRPRP
uniref:Uncharacterized protein n=1 Tax=Oryctolagus cuniculus TaxID=9986 RepID=A0A5F9DL10_RABIT